MRGKTITNSSRSVVPDLRTEQCEKLISILQYDQYSSVQVNVSSQVGHSPNEKSKTGKAFICLHLMLVTWTLGSLIRSL